MNRRCGLAVLAVVLMGCAAASTPPPRPISSIERVVRISIQPDVWSPHEHELIHQGINRLEIPGVRFVFTETTPDLRIVRWPRLPCDPPRPGCQARGCYEHPTRFVFLDPTMLPSDGVWLHVVMHEILHFLGARHVCREAREVAYCSPVGYGRAIMNPSVDPAENVQRSKNRYGPLPTLQPLDWAELRRVGVVR